MMKQYAVWSRCPGGAWRNESRNGTEWAVARLMAQAISEVERAVTRIVPVGTPRP